MGAIGTALKEIREKYGLSQSMLADHLKCRVSHVANMEHGAVKYPWSYIKKLGPDLSTHDKAKLMRAIEADIREELGFKHEES